ncbi:MAG: GAF domain-containing protein, partial [Cyanobacteria bacterium P01_E01_bin.6]
MASDPASAFSFDKKDQGLLRVLTHINQTLERDAAVCDSVMLLRKTLQVNRVVLYYFYREWE